MHKITRVDYLCVNNERREHKRGKQKQADDKEKLRETLVSSVNVPDNPRESV